MTGANPDGILGLLTALGLDTSAIAELRGRIDASASYRMETRPARVIDSATVDGVTTADVLPLDNELCVAAQNRFDATYHTPIDPVSVGPPRRGHSVTHFTVPADCTVGLVELQVKTSAAAVIGDHAVWVAIYSSVDANFAVARTLVGTLGSRDAHQISFGYWSLFSFVAASEISLVPGVHYWLAICSAEPGTFPIVDRWCDGVSSTEVNVRKLVEVGGELLKVNNNDGVAAVSQAYPTATSTYDDYTNHQIWYRLYERSHVVQDVPMAEGASAPQIGDIATVRRIGGIHSTSEVIGPAGGQGLRTASAGHTSPTSGTSNHALLSATHNDTLAGAPIQGALIYANATPKWATTSGLYWDEVNDRLAILGAGAVVAAPAYPLHVERTASGADRCLGFFKNAEAGADSFAEIQVENEVGGHNVGLVMLGSTYTHAGRTDWANKGLLISSEDASGLIIAADAGKIEFWLYQGAYPAGAYTHVADVTSDGAYNGIFPHADSAYALGGEAGPLRWADGSFDQIHLNAHLVTCEGASILGQDYSTDSATVQFAKLGLGAAPSATAGDLLYMYGGGGAAGRTTINLGDSGWAVPSAAGAVSDGDKAIFYNVGSEKYALGLEAGHLWIQGPTKFYVGATGIAEVDNTAFFPLAASIDLGLSGQYFDYAFINRIYLNSTAYFSGATAGAADLYGDLTLATAYKTIKGTAGNTLWRITGKYTGAGTFPSDVVLSNNYFYTDGTIGTAAQSTAMILARCTPDDTVGIIDFMLGIRNTAPTSKLTVGQAVVTVASGIALKLGNARVANADAAITGYVTVQDSAGATYKLAIIN